jgi:hypothetical protein
VIAFQCTLLQSHPSHSRYSPQSILAPINVAPKTPDAIHHTPATSFGYFALSIASPIHSPTGSLVPTPASAHGLSLHAPSRYTLPDWHMFAGSIPLPASRLPLSVSAYGTWLSTQCDTLDHILSALSFDNSCPYYTNSRFKTACLKGRGFYPIYRQ